MPKYYQDRGGNNNIKGGSSIRSYNSGSRGGSSCNNSYRSDGSKKQSLKNMFSRSALAKKISMLNNSSVFEDGATITDMSSVEVMDKYATYASDDETSKTSNTIQKNCIKYEAEDTLMVIAEASETPIVYESHYPENQYAQSYENSNRKMVVVEAESEGFCSADDEDSLVPPPRPPIIVNNNRKGRKNYRSSRRVPEPVPVTSDEDTSFYSESFEVMHSPNDTDIEDQHINNQTKYKKFNNQGNNTLILFQQLVSDFCGVNNQVDAIDDNSNSILIYNSSSADSFQNSDDGSSVSSSFGCHDLDFREEIRAEIIDARLAFNRLVEYFKGRCPTQQENQSYGNAREPARKRKHKKRSNRRRRS